MKKLIIVFLVVVLLLSGCSASTTTTTTTTTIPQPIVYEQDTNNKNSQPLTINLSPGERIEVEVVSDGPFIVSTIRDPYGNIIFQSYHQIAVGDDQSTFSSDYRDEGGLLCHKSPWQCAFFPALDGVYTFEVFLFSGHLKVTVYSKDQ